MTSNELFLFTALYKYMLLLLNTDYKLCFNTNRTVTCMDSIYLNPNPPEMNLFISNSV